MSSSDDSIQGLKIDDDIDDDVDETDWKEPVKDQPSSTKEEEGVFKCFFNECELEKQITIFKC